MKILALPPTERNGLYTLVPKGWDRESNYGLGVPTLVMLSFLADHLRMSVSTVGEHLGLIVEIEIELKPLGAFLETVCHQVFNRLSKDDMNCVCGYDGVLIRAFQSMVRQCFAMGIFSVFRRIHCNPILALLAIALLAEVDLDASGAEWFPFMYERGNNNHGSESLHSYTRLHGMEQQISLPS